MIFCLDLETTGLPTEREEEKAGIIEIGGCWLTDAGRRCGEFFRECRPLHGSLIEEGALAVNGYTRERIFDPKRMTTGQAVIELLGFIRTGMEESEGVKVQLAAWNAPFEMRHLRHALSLEWIEPPFWPFRHSVIDPQSILTADLIRSFLPTERGGPMRRFEPLQWGGLVQNSDHAAQILGIPPEARPHRAIHGARQVKAVLEALGLREAA